MKLRIILGLFISCVVYSCSHRPANSVQQHENNNSQIKQKIGLKIEYGMNQGIRADASRGITNPFIYTTAVITNDSDELIHLHMALSETYEFPSFCGDDEYKYKVVLLPEELTPDTATLRNTIIGGSEDYFKTDMTDPNSLNKTLKPGEYCVVTVGTLYPGKSNCEVIPRAIFSRDNMGLYEACDRQLNQIIPTDVKVELGVKLEYYNQRKFIPPEDGCVVIPFGQIRYLEK